MKAENIIEVRDLQTHFKLYEGTLKAVEHVDFDLKTGKTLGIIGESGCGKSVTAHSILNTVQTPGKVIGGSVMYRTKDGKEENLLKQGQNSKFMRSVRGREISMIFQEPMTSMSPVYTIGQQMIESYLVHFGKPTKALKKEAYERAIEMLTKVGMQNPALRINDYPHQLSGGMCQRAMIAMALMHNPTVLICDEPTTALDVTVQAQITELMQKLQADMNMSMIYITHDMGVIAEVAHDIAVMYLGRVVETGSALDIFENPSHPYTIRLLRSIPKIGKKIPGVRLDAISGNVPVPIDPIEQCGFFSRCLSVNGLPACETAVPELTEVSPGHFVRCHHCSKGGCL